jgi:serpin B
MRYLTTLTALILSSWVGVACTSPADVASKSSAEGGNGGTDTTTGGSGSSIGGSSTTPQNAEEVRSDVPAVTTPDISDGEYASFITSINAFGLDLNQKLTVDSNLVAKNSVFSPTSAQLALAMTYGGAVGATATAMQTALRDSFGDLKYHAGCNRLLRDLAARNYSTTNSAGVVVDRVELVPSNSLWTERTMAIKTPFLDLLSQQYDSGMWRVDFIGQPDPSRLAINAWVEGRTHDRIKDLLAEGDISTDTRFVIVNALYLYANWQKRFDKPSTQPAAFHLLSGSDVNVDTMHVKSNMHYNSTADVEVLRVPYITGNLWMTIVLPQAGQFEATRAQISAAWLADLTSTPNSIYVALALPKFKLETPQLQLNQPLTDLGMGPIFEQTANFSGISDEQLFISKVIQKAFIAVDEDGTEAAAATAVVGDTVSLPPTPTPFVVDRPFLFFIQDKTGLVLFSGQIVDPTQP